MREQTLSRQESEPGLDQAANLKDRHVGTPPNPRTRSVTGGSHDAEKHRAEEERLKRKRKAWNSLQGQKIAMMRAAERDLRILTEERQAKLDDLERINEELRQSERRREKMRLEEENEERQAELEKPVYNEHVQKLEEERREHAQQWALTRRQAKQDQEMPRTSFQRAYAPLIAALNAAFTKNQLPTSTPQSPTVVPNLMLPDSAGLNSSTSVGPQPPAVANPVVAPPQTTIATEIVANLSRTASNMRPILTAVLSASAYIPIARRPYADSRPIHGPNLNVNRSQTDGTPRTSVTVVSTATIGNSLPPLNLHATMNTRTGDNHSQVASAQRNIMQHYSTELELQQVMELNAVDEEIRRFQAKRTAIVVGTVDFSTSTLNPNLSAPQSATLNPFA